MANDNSIGSLDNNTDASGFALSVNVTTFINNLKTAETALDNLAKKADTTNADIQKKFEETAKKAGELGDSLVKAGNTSDKIFQIVQNLDKLEDVLKSTSKEAKKTIPSDMFSLMEGNLKQVNEKIKTFDVLLKAAREDVEGTGGVNNLATLSTEMNRLLALQEKMKAEAKQKVAVPIDVSSYTTSINSVKELQSNIKLLKSLLTNALKADPSETKTKNVEELTKAIKKEEAELKKLKNTSLAATKEEKLRAVATKKAITQETAQTKIAEKALRNYISAMGLSENSYNSRLKKINAILVATRGLKAAEGEHKKEVTQAAEAVKRLYKANKSAAESGEQIKNKFKGMSSLVDGLVGKVVALFAVRQAGRFISQLAKIRGEFEMQNVALQALLKNKYKADQLFDQLTKLAVRSPFQLKDLITYTKQLAAYRFEASELYDTTKKLADVSAGVGVDMARLVLALGQVKAANYLRGQELRQFSEAGINILGELADKFTALEGHIVTTGDIFERVTKRMVSYQDVADVFDTLTEKGGLFYNMQEIQAKTLSGELSNLKDSFQIMMNEIGKSQQGIMISGIHLAKFLMSNYETVEHIIIALTLAYGGYTIATIAHMKAKGLLVKVNTKAIASEIGLRKQILKSTMALQNLKKTLNFTAKGLGITAAITAVIALGYALYRAVEKSNKLKAAFDKLSGEIVRQKTEFNNLIGSLKEYNAQVSELKEQLEDTSSEEDRIAIEGKLSDVEKERTEIILKLKRQYPDYASNLDLTTASTKELKESSDEYNESLRIRLYLNNLLSETKTGLFEKGVAGQITAITDAFAAQNDAINEGTAARQNAIVTITKLLDKGGLSDYQIEKYKGFISYLENVNPEDFTIDKYFEYVSKNMQGIKNSFSSEARDMEKKLVESSSNLLRAKDDIVQAKVDLETSISNVFESALISEKFTPKSKEAIAKMTKEQVAEYNRQVERLRSDIKPVLESLNITDPKVKEFVDRLAKEKIGIDIFPTDIKSEIGAFEKSVDETVDRINSKIKNSLETVLPKKVGKNGVSSYFSDVAGTIKTLREEIDKYSKPSLRTRANIDLLRMYNTTIEDTMDDETIRKKGLEGMNQVLNAYLEIQRQYNEEEKKTTSTDSSTILKDRVTALKNANTEYEKLLKTYSSEEAKELTKSAFGGTFKALKMPIDIDFDKDSTIANIEDIAKIATPKVKEDIESTLSSLTIDAKIEVKKEELDKTKSLIDDYFDKQKIAASLVSKGAPKDMVESFFGSADLDVLKKKITDAMSGMTGSDAKEAYQDYLDDIASMQYDQQVANAKTYITNYITSLDEQTKIAEEYNKKIADVEKSIFLTNSQKKLAIYRLQVAKEGELDNLRWKEYKNSANYQRIFDDLDNSSTQTLNHIKDELIDMMETADNMSPESMKTLREQITKLEDELTSRNPFKTLKEGIEEVKKSSNDLGFALNNEIKAQVDYNTAVELYGKNSIEAAEALDKLKKAEENLSGAQNSKKKGLNNVQKGIDGINDYVEAATQSLDDIIDGLKAFGIKIGSGLEKALSGLGDLGSAAKDIASGDPISMIKGVGEAVKGFGEIYTSIFGDHDAKKQKAIEKQQDLIEDLESAYEDLSDTIDDAYEIDTLSNAYAEQEKTIRQENESYQKMIAAERSKKDSDNDKIDEWTDAIEENNEKIADLTSERLEALGGINAKSAAEEYAEAFQEAFFEIGDGYDALMDSMDDQLKNLILKQSMLRIGDKFMKPLFDAVDNALEDSRITANEMSDILAQEQETAEDLNSSYKTIYKGLGLTQDSFADSTISGLQQGISTVSEDTAGVIESYMNSLRYFAADRNEELVNIRTMIEEQYGSSDSPMLLEVREIKNLVYQISTDISSVVKATSTQGGSGIKVFID